MLRLTAGATAGAVLPLAGLVSCSGDSSTSPDPGGSDPAAGIEPSPLPIPDRLFGPIVNLEMRPGMREFLPDRPAPTRGYNGDFLGPTLVLRTGSDVSLNVTNNIGIATTTHWHGFHVPAAMDGGPHQRIDPGTVWTASFPLLNRAATYWYHPHLHAATGQGVIFDPLSTGYQVYEGLAGMIIVEDAISDSLPLPRSYGVDDIPLILQDRRFESDGSLLHFPSDFNAATDPALRKGGHFLANGVEAAVLEVGAQVVRLRILNASNARIYNLGFSDARTFFQIASDGGFLSAPAPLTRLLLSPAERAEILVDFGSDEGSTLRLRSFNGGMGTALVPFPLQDTWDNTDFDLLEITVGLHARTPCWRSRRGSRRSKRFPRPRPSTWGAPDPSSSRPTRSASTAYGWT